MTILQVGLIISIFMELFSAAVYVLAVCLNINDSDWNLNKIQGLVAINALISFILLITICFIF